MSNLESLRKTGAPPSVWLLMLRIVQSLLVEHRTKVIGNFTDLFFETRQLPLTDPP